MNMQFKKDPFIAIIWVLVIAGVGFLFYKDKINWMIGVGFLTTLGLPSLLGKKEK